MVSIFIASLYKGQLISKADCQAEDSSKKRTNEFVFTSMRRVFVRFLEESSARKKRFEIIWPLLKLRLFDFLAEYIGVTWVLAVGDATNLNQLHPYDATPYADMNSNGLMISSKRNVLYCNCNCIFVKAWQLFLLKEIIIDDITQNAFDKDIA